MDQNYWIVKTISFHLETIVFSYKNYCFQLLLHLSNDWLNMFS